MVVKCGTVDCIRWKEVMDAGEKSLQSQAVGNRCKRRVQNRVNGRPAHEGHHGLGGLHLLLDLTRTHVQQWHRERHVVQ